MRVPPLLLLGAACAAAARVTGAACAAAARVTGVAAATDDLRLDHCHVEGVAVARRSTKYVVGRPHQRGAIYATCDAHGQLQCFEDPGLADAPPSAFRPVACDTHTIHARRRKLGVAINLKEDKWPNGLVFYRFSTKFPLAEREREMVRQAIQVYESTDLGVAFQECEPTTLCKNEYIDIAQKEDACYSYVGFTGEGGGQILNLGTSCFEESGTAVHELGHALGLFHEHTHPQREVIVLTDANLPVSASNYAKETDALLKPYDKNSIMHYGRSAGLCLPKDQYPLESFCDVEVTTNCVMPKKTHCNNTRNSEIGQRTELSAGDLNTLKAIYGTQKPTRRPTTAPSSSPSATTNAPTTTTPVPSSTQTPAPSTKSPTSRPPEPPTPTTTLPPPTTTAPPPAATTPQPSTTAPAPTPTPTTSTPTTTPPPSTTAPTTTTPTTTTPAPTATTAAPSPTTTAPTPVTTTPVSTTTAPAPTTTAPAPTTVPPTTSPAPSTTAPTPTTTIPTVTTRVPATTTSPPTSPSPAPSPTLTKAPQTTAPGTPTTTEPATLAPEATTRKPASTTVPPSSLPSQSQTPRPTTRPTTARPVPVPVPVPTMTTKPVPTATTRRPTPTASTTTEPDAPNGYQPGVVVPDNNSPAWWNWWNKNKWNKKWADYPSIDGNGKWWQSYTETETESQDVAGDSDHSNNNNSPIQQSVPSTKKATTPKPTPKPKPKGKSKSGYSFRGWWGR